MENDIETPMTAMEPQLLALYDANAYRITQLEAQIKPLLNEVECLKGMIERLTQAIADFKNSKSQ